MSQKSQPFFLAAFLPQLLGHNGISRFNRNLVQALNDALDGRIHALNDPQDQGFHGYTRNKWRFYRAFFSAVLKKPDSILIGHLNFIPLTIISWLFGVKTIVILHGIEAWNIRKRSSFFLNFPSQYWAVSQYTKTQFQVSSKLNEDKVVQIFNTLPPDWTEDHEVRYSSYFLSVCRLVKEESYKGVDLSIKAVAALKDKMQALGFSYIIVGHGDDVQRHRELAEQYGVGDLVHFKEGLSDSELSQLYARCNFFILPSTGEGFGIVFLEAMAYKKACVGAKNCGSEDVISDQKTGFLIEQKEEEIKRTLKNLLDNQEQVITLGKAGYEKLENEFSFPRFSKRINELIDQCVA